LDVSTTADAGNQGWLWQTLTDVIPNPQPALIHQMQGS